MEDTVRELPVHLLLQIDRYWARYLGCRISALRSPEPIVVSRSAGPDLVALQVDGAWVISMSPAAAERVNADVLLDRLEQLPADGSRDGELLAWFDRAGLPGMYGPARLHYVTPALFRPVPPAPFRPLTQADLRYFERFAHGMGGHLDYRLSDARFPYVIGSFIDGELVSVGAVQIWDDLLAETYGDTLPEYRGNGLARALVSELTRWVLEETSYIPQEDGIRANTASMRIAERLGYVPYGTLVMNNLSLQLNEL